MPVSKSGTSRSRTTTTRKAPPKKRTVKEKKPTELNEWYEGEPEDLTSTPGVPRWSREQLLYMPHDQLIDVLLKDNFEAKHLRGVDDTDLINWYLDVNDAGNAEDADDADDDDDVAAEGNAEDDDDEPDDGYGPQYGDPDFDADDDSANDGSIMGVSLGMNPDAWENVVAPLLLAIDAGMIDPHLRDIALACRHRHYAIMGEEEPDDERPRVVNASDVSPTLRPVTTPAPDDDTPQGELYGIEMPRAALVNVRLLDDYPTVKEICQWSSNATGYIVLNGWTYRKTDLEGAYFRVPMSFDAPMLGRGCIAKITSVGRSRIEFQLVERVHHRSEATIKRVMESKWYTKFEGMTHLFGPRR